MNYVHLRLLRFVAVERQLNRMEDRDLGIFGFPAKAMLLRLLPPLRKAG
jgi:hypothetical protein